MTVMGLTHCVGQGSSVDSMDKSCQRLQEMVKKSLQSGGALSCKQENDIVRCQWKKIRARQVTNSTERLANCSPHSLWLFNSTKDSPTTGCFAPTHPGDSRPTVRRSILQRCRLKNVHSNKLLNDKVPNPLSVNILTIQTTAALYAASGIRSVGWVSEATRKISPLNSSLCLRSQTPLLYSNCTTIPLQDFPSWRSAFNPRWLTMFHHHEHSTIRSPHWLWSLRSTYFIEEPTLSKGCFGSHAQQASGEPATSTRHAHPFLLGNPSSDI